MVRWHHRLDAHEFEQAPRIGDGQGSLACCSPCGCKESDTTEWLNWLKSEFMSKISFLTPLCLRLGIITTKWHSTNSNVSALYLTSTTFQNVNLNTFRWGQNFPTHRRPLSVLPQARQLHWSALPFWTMKHFYLPPSEQLPWIKQISCTGCQLSELELKTRSRM